MKNFDHAKKLIDKLLFLVAGFSLVGCNPGAPSGQTEFVAGGAASPLTQAEYNNLPTEQQYQVTTKLLGTLYRGMAVYEQ